MLLKSEFLIKQRVWNMLWAESLEIRKYIKGFLKILHQHGGFKGSVTDLGYIFVL